MFSFQVLFLYYSRQQTQINFITHNKSITTIVILTNICCGKDTTHFCLLIFQIFLCNSSLTSENFSILSLTNSRLYFSAYISFGCRHPFYRCFFPIFFCCAIEFNVFVRNLLLTNMSTKTNLSSAFHKCFFLSFLSLLSLLFHSFSQI